VKRVSKENTSLPGAVNDNIAAAAAVAVAAADVIWEDVGDPISFGEPLEFLLRVIHH